MSLITPRPYQKEAIAAIKAAAARGVNRQLVSLPTGAGKSIVFGMLAAATKARTLILAHREELLRQAVAKIRMVSQSADVGILQADTDDGLDAKICVASVATAVRPKRLEALERRGFMVCVVDEAHHATADTYQKILGHLGFLADKKDRLLVGVTATAFRGDGIALGEVFQEVVYERTILSMIKAGYLCDARGISVSTETDISSVHTRGGDFVPSELAFLLNTPERNRLVVQSYIEHAADRKAAAFCADVQHAKDLAQAFVEAGIQCEPVWGEMSQEQRRRVLEDYASGKVRVVTNCAILTEGWDDPETSAILLARPTKSATLYTQIVGRGLRVFPGKEDCLVIDFADTVGRHNLCGLATLAGNPKLKPKRGESLREAVERFDMAEEWKNERIGAVKSEEVSLFEASSFVWQAVGGIFRLSVGDGGAISIRPVQGGFMVVLTSADGQQTMLSDEPLPMGYAQGVAEDWVRLNAPRKLVDKNASWRARGASEAQLKELARLKIPHDPRTITRGEASGLIDIERARKTEIYSQPATIKQIKRLEKSGISVPRGLTKGQASRLIAQSLREAVAES